MGIGMTAASKARAEKKVVDLTGDCGALLAHLGDLFTEAQTGATDWGKVSRLTNMKEALVRAVGIASGLEPEEIEETLAELRETA